jgi:hypothetical protein
LSGIALLLPLLAKNSTIVAPSARAGGADGRTARSGKVWTALMVSSPLGASKLSGNGLHVVPALLVFS